MHDSLLSLTWIPGCYPSAGARWYVERGKEVPGRAVMRMLPADREKLIKTDFANVAPWWIKAII